MRYKPPPSLEDITAKDRSILLVQNCAHLSCALRRGIHHAGPHRSQSWSASRTRHPITWRSEATLRHPRGTIARLVWCASRHRTPRLLSRGAGSVMGVARQCSKTPTCSRCRLTCMTSSRALPLAQALLHATSRFCCLATSGPRRWTRMDWWTRSFLAAWTATTMAGGCVYACPV